MVLTETWHMASSDLPLRCAAPADYNIVDAPRLGHDNDAGVNHRDIAIIHRTSFTSRIIASPLRLASFELLTCFMRTTHIKFIFVAVYRLSSQYVTELFFEEFTGLLEVVSAYHTSVIISRDLNIHVDDADDASALRFLDIIDAFGFTQYITGPTHVRSHTLDHIIMQPSCATHDIVVDPPIFSDHQAVSL